MMNCRRGLKVTATILFPLNRFIVTGPAFPGNGHP